MRAWRRCSEQVERDKDEHLEQMRQAARLQNDAVSYKAQVDNLSRERERLRQRSEQAAETPGVARPGAAGADRGRRGAAGAGWPAARQDAGRAAPGARPAAPGCATRPTQRAADLRAERSGLASRIEVLEGLERSHEGFGTGVREVFALLEQADPGPWRTVARHGRRLPDRAPRVRPADRPGPGRAGPALPGARRRAAGAGAAPARAAVLRPGQLPAAVAAAADASPTISATDWRLPRSPAARRAIGLPGVAPAEQVVRCDDPRAGRPAGAACWAAR